MAALYRNESTGSGLARTHAYRAQADLCRRLASAGHGMDARQNLEDIAACYDRLADDLDHVEVWRSSRVSAEAQPVHRRRSRLRRAALISLVKAS
jgi:hypothetical protein